MSHQKICVAKHLKNVKIVLTKISLSAHSEYSNWKCIQTDMLKWHLSD